MIVAQVCVTTSRLGFSETKHTVTYSELATAYSDYHRVADLLLQRLECKNDLPNLIELDGESGTSLTVPLDEVFSVALFDFAKANAAEVGVKDAFPLLFKIK